MANCTAPETIQGPADILEKAIPSDTVPGVTSEISAAMLDVHAPHESIHSWKNFLVHIAAIVVGLLIAVSLEQTVELLHHSHQRHELQEALRRNGEGNRQYIKEDLAVAQGMLDWALEQTKAVERADTTGVITIRRMPAGLIYAPDAGVWLSAKASGVTSLLSAGAQNWYEDMDDRERATFGSSDSATDQLNAAYSALDQALAEHAVETSSGELDLSMLTAAQRETVIECFHSVVSQLRSVMRHFIAYSNDNEYILQTPLTSWTIRTRKSGL